jgi:anhydro-N-acetylmuramic acid kinase
MAGALAVGLMSGTSADGVTAVLARFEGRSVETLALRTLAYPPALRRLVLDAPNLRAAELSRLNFALGERFARAARSVIGGRKPEVVGSHGQTVWHGPNAAPANTLQLAEPSVIAERLGLPVVADFRPRDMAAGGQGAPLVPAFDEFLFSGGPLRALQNIGGIGNVSLVGRGKLWAAFDTGPGNGLMDRAASLATGGRLALDRGGRLAAAGRADEAAVARMLAHPYFKKRGPKSLDRDDFGEAFLRRWKKKKLEDTLATLNLFTASSIARSYEGLPRRQQLAEVVVAGGGALNPVLMRNLQRLLAPVPVVTSAAHGIPIMAKEAVAFAWMALRAFRGQTNNCPAATGARRRLILGKVVPA